MLPQTATARPIRDRSSAAATRRSFALVGLIAAMVGMLAAPASAHQPVPAQVEALAETVQPFAGISGLAQAFALGKFNAELIPAPRAATVRSAPLPVIIEIAGKGGLYDALIAGKFDTDFASGDPGVKYVRTPDTAATVGGRWAALDQGKLDSGLTDAGPTAQPPVITYPPTPTGGHQR